MDCQHAQQALEAPPRWRWLLGGLIVFGLSTSPALGADDPEADDPGADDPEAELSGADDSGANLPGAEPAAAVPIVTQPDDPRPASPQKPAPPSLAEGTLPGLPGGRSAVSLSAGFPWFGFRYQHGLAGGWSPVVEVESALFIRTTASLGLARVWLEKPHLRLGGQVSLGYLIQTTQAEEAGPTFEASMTLAAPFRRVCPMLELSTRHSALLTALAHEAEEQDSLVVNVKHQWAPRATLGLAVGLSPRLALDAGLDLTWFGPGTVSIPGLHVGLNLAWDRPARTGGALQ